MKNRISKGIVTADGIAAFCSKRRSDIVAARPRFLKDPNRTEVILLF